MGVHCRPAPDEEHGLTDGRALSEALYEMENSPLGRSLLETLRIAQEATDAVWAREQADKRAFRCSGPRSAVERLSEALLDACGPVEDAWLIRRAAEGAVEAQREHDDARRP